MTPFDLTKAAVSRAADFEETAQRIASKFGIDADELQRVAADISAISGVPATVALGQIETIMNQMRGPR